MNDFIRLNSDELNRMARHLLREELQALIVDNAGNSRSATIYTRMQHKAIHPETTEAELRQLWDALWGNTVEYGSMNTTVTAIDCAVYDKLRAVMPESRATLVDVAFIRNYIAKNTYVNVAGITKRKNNAS